MRNVYFLYFEVAQVNVPGIYTQINIENTLTHPSETHAR